jgi:methyl-accepting chemotaxis protein
MHILSRLRLRTKLAVLLGLSALAVVASIAVASSILHQRMLDDRLEKLHSVSEAASGVAQALQAQVTAHAITQEQALDQFRRAIHAIRFDAGAGYVVAQTIDPDMVLAHGGNPALEGKASSAKDPTGRPLTDLIRQALGSGTETQIAYMFPKPGQTTPMPKVSYVIRFPPWNMVFVVGSFTDDLDAAFHATIEELALIGGAILVLTMLTAWLVNRDIATSLGRLQSVMTSLADGKLETDVPGTDRQDEVGRMAGTVLVFRQRMVRAEQMTVEREQERERAEQAKLAALTAMAETIETEAKQALAEVGRHTTAMTDAANAMSASATRTGNSAKGAAGAAGQALSNAQTVASAAEELSASIREIAGQVSQSSAVVSRAVEAGRSTRETISALNEQVARIGSVADMISEIAARTNLLALNATIEAARAGDAGKGFAVVASEVKQLATQTARSTEEIGRHIADVRAATGASVTAVGRIEDTISEINAIAGSIAAAVEEQGAATTEIARNVSETAAAANEMTSRTNEVFSEAQQTGRQAGEVLTNTVDLNAAMEDLHKAVIHLVRTSTSELDRRRYRRRPCLVEATITCRGHSETGLLHDISERGCAIVSTLDCRVGDRLDVVLTGRDIRLTCSVIEISDGRLHVAIEGDGLSPQDADRISLSTISDLVRMAKGDHAAFVQRVVDAVANQQKLPPASLATAHHCRFGRWYDNVSDLRAMALPSFKSIAAPHESVHELGRQALVALERDDIAMAQRSVAEMRGQSEQVVRHLDTFTHEYPQTFAEPLAA